MTAASQKVSDKQDELKKQGSEILFNTVRRISLMRLQDISGVEEIKILEEPMSTRLIFAHWKSSILLSGHAIQLQFKTYFNSRNTSSLISQKFKKSEQDVSVMIIKDFFREFCNVTAGGLKSFFLAHNVKTGISLPLVTRSFDDILEEEKDQDNRIFDVWRLQSGKTKITCAVEAFVNDWNALSEIEEHQDLKLNGGEIEFL